MASGGSPSSDNHAQREILLSMYQFNFWDYVHRPTPPAIPSSFSQAPLLSSAHTQIEYQPPLYYLLASTVYRLVAESDILTQLLVLRTFSAFLGTLVVLFAYLLCRELFPTRRFLLLGVPTFIALSAMYWFIAGSVNNDVLAAAEVAALLYLLVRILVRGISLPMGLLAVILVVVSVFSKRTALIAFPLSLIAVPLYLWGRHVTIPRKWISALIAFAALVLLVGWQIASLRGNDADGWTEMNHHWMDDRSGTYSRTGSYAFHLRKENTDAWQYLAQFLPSDQGTRLKGKTVILRAWVRGSKEGESGFVMVSDGVGSKILNFQAGSAWQPIQLPHEISPDAEFVRVALGAGTASFQGRGEMYFDDVTLSDGLVADSSANLIRNGSAEAASWMWEESKAVKYLGSAIGGWTALLSGRDFALEVGHMYWTALETAFKSYWGVFGWMSLELDAGWYLGILAVVTAAAAGLVAGTFQSSRGRVTIPDHRKAGLWLLLTSVLLALTTVLVTHNPASSPNTLPQGRYLFPVLVPGAALFVLGLQKLVPVEYRGPAIFCCTSGFFLLDSALLFNYVIPFFYR